MFQLVEMLGVQQQLQSTQGEREDAAAAETIDPFAQSGLGLLVPTVYRIAPSSRTCHGDAVCCCHRDDDEFEFGVLFLSLLCAGL
jgi:hypothetical protein